MENLQLTQAPVAKTGMLIRRPVAEVFEAFVDPEITTKFWFTKSSGRLEAGKEVQWEWEMYGMSIPVTVKVVEPNERIVIEWPGYGSPTTVEWTFTPLEDGTTFVRIRNDGFTGDGDALVRQAIDSGQGFTWVLAGLKALLEHNVRLNLVADRFPKGIEEH
ncbi:MAG TPA: SRPBCC family protein [Thermoanaerobaculia bacterium]|nr:SRPBCC family protein [Thermoanaerobaculia bacterium]